MKPNNSIRFLQ